MAAYGRLDVYSPEGPIDTYSLEKPVISVGRQSGNDIVLDTAGISRYHFVLELRGDHVVLIDKESQNGTYIDGVKVLPDEEHLLQEGEEIQVGDLRIVFHSNAQADIPTGESQRLDAERKTFRVEVEDTDLSVTPGAHTQTVVKIFNIGDAPDSYEVGIEGVPKEWTRLDRVTVEIPPGGTNAVVFSLKPLRRPDSRPGLYEVRAHVASKEHPGEEVDAPVNVHVLSYSGFGIVLGTPRVNAEQRFEIYTQNQGSGSLPVQFTGVQKQGRLVFDINPSSVTLNAGEKRTVRGTIRPTKPRLFGKPEEIHYDIIAQARDASGFKVPVTGIFVDQPRLPKWFPLAAGGGALAVLVLLLGVFLVLPSLAGVLTPSATPTLAPTVTPVQIDLPTFTQPPSLTPTSTATPTVTPTPTLSETDITATSNAASTQIAALTAVSGAATQIAVQTYAAQQTLTANLTNTSQPQATQTTPATPASQVTPITQPTAITPTALVAFPPAATSEPQATVPATLSPAPTLAPTLAPSLSTGTPQG